MPWNPRVAEQEGYSILPCADFREVTSPRSPGCKKRMPGMFDPLLRLERISASNWIWRNGPYHSWSNAEDWTKLSFGGANSNIDGRSEIRIGLTASLSGSLADPTMTDSLIASLSDFAVRSVYGASASVMDPTNPMWYSCLAICIQDDQSSKLKARELYERFADPSSDYNVDFILGPASFDFRGEAALVAERFGMPVLLWSYPTRFYSIGLGSTHDPGLDGEGTLRPTLQLKIVDTSFRPDSRRAEGGSEDSFYVAYHKRGPQQRYKTTNAALLSDDAAVNTIWDYSDSLAAVTNADTIIFELRQVVGSSIDLTSDPVVASTTLTLLVLQGVTATKTAQLNLKDRLGKDIQGAQLQVEYSISTMDWVSHYAKQFEKYREAQENLLTSFKWQMASMANGSAKVQEPRLEPLKPAFPRSYVGPNFHNVHPISLSRAGEYREEAMEVLADTMSEVPFREAGVSTDYTWRIKGPCTVDSSDCLTSPNYPNHYTNTELCVVELAFPGSGDSHYLALTDMDSEFLHDMLWIQGSKRFYSGQEIIHEPLLLKDAQEIVWLTDSTVTNRGWRLCVLPVTDQSCSSFECAEGYKLKADFLSTTCTGRCAWSDCCEQVTDPDADGHLWDQGFTNIFDITVPMSQWPRDALTKLRRAGAASVVGVVTRGAVRRDLVMCKETVEWAQQELGYARGAVMDVPFVVDWVDLSQLSTLAILDPDVILVCGDASTVDALLTVATAANAQFKAILTSRPWGAPLKIQGLKSNEVNYVLEPLPWPSPQWMLAEYQESFIRWTALLLQRTGQWPNLLHIQLMTVESLLNGALRDPVVKPMMLDVNTTAAREYFRSLGGSGGGMVSLMGNINFTADGRRFGCQTGTLQHTPLPYEQSRGDRSARLDWLYWSSRNLFSELRYVVDFVENVSDTIERAGWYVNDPTSIRLTGETGVIQNVEVTHGPPPLPSFTKLSYPRPKFRLIKREVYPCPRGCEIDGLVCKACPPGKYRSDLEEHCVACPTGRRMPAWAAAQCPPCPVGGKCDGDPSKPVSALPGYFRYRVNQGGFNRAPDSCSLTSGNFPSDVHNQSTLNTEMLSCSPRKWLCLGGQSNACYGNNRGLVCMSCPAGYSYMHAGTGRHLCKKCPSRISAFFTHVIPVILFFTALAYGVNMAVIRDAQVSGSIVTPVIRQMFEHAVVTDILIITTKLDSEMDFVPITDVVLRPMEVMMPDCFLMTGIAKTKESHLKELQLMTFLGLSWLVIGWLCIVFILLIRTTFAQLRHHYQQRPHKKVPVKVRQESKGKLAAAQERFKTMHVRHVQMRMCHDAVRHAYIWLFLSLPAVLRCGIRNVKCMSVGGLPDLNRLVANFEVSCDDPEYMKMVFPIALLMVLVVAVVVPVFLLAQLYRKRSDQSLLDHRLTMGIFFQGFRREHWWFQTAVMYRWVCLLLATLVRGGINRSMATVVLLIGFQGFKEAAEPFVPFNRNALVGLYNVSFRIQIFVFSVGCFKLLPEALTLLSGSDLARFVEPYLPVMIVMTETATAIYFLYAIHVIFYNQVAVPFKVDNPDSEQANELLKQKSWITRAVVSLATKIYGMNTMTLESVGKHHFLLNVEKLNDSERPFMVQGCIEATKSLMVTTNWQVCPEWIVQVLRGGLNLVHRDHRARITAMDQKQMQKVISARGLPSMSLSVAVQAVRSQRKKTHGAMSDKPRKHISYRERCSSVILGPTRVFGGETEVDVSENILVDELVKGVFEYGMDVEDHHVHFRRIRPIGSSTEKGEDSRGVQAKDSVKKRRSLSNTAKGHHDEGQTVRKGREFAQWSNEITEMPRVGSREQPPRTFHVLPTLEAKDVLAGEDSPAVLSEGDTSPTVLHQQPLGKSMTRMLTTSTQRVVCKEKSKEDIEQEMQAAADERRADLRRRILEAKWQLRELKLKYQHMDDGKGEAKVYSNSSFLVNQAQFASNYALSHKVEEGDVEMQLQLGSTKHESLRQDISPKNVLAEMPDDEHSEAGSEKEGRGQFGIFTSMLKHFNTDTAAEVTSPTSQDARRASSSHGLERTTGWFDFLGPATGGGGPSNLPVPKRVPLPPPVKAPPAGTHKIRLASRTTAEPDVEAPRAGAEEPPLPPPAGSSLEAPADHKSPDAHRRGAPSADGDADGCNAAPGDESPDVLV